VPADAGHRPGTTQTDVGRSPSSAPSEEPSAAPARRDSGEWSPDASGPDTDPQAGDPSAALLAGQANLATGSDD
jgi:hypothetical protein